MEPDTQHTPVNAPFTPQTVYHTPGKRYTAGLFHLEHDCLFVGYNQPESLVYRKIQRVALPLSFDRRPGDGFPRRLEQRNYLEISNRYRLPRHSPLYIPDFKRFILCLSLLEKSRRSQHFIHQFDHPASLPFYFFTECFPPARFEPGQQSRGFMGLYQGEKRE